MSRYGTRATGKPWVLMKADKIRSEFPAAAATLSVLAVVSFIGLWLFWSPSRYIYALCAVLDFAADALRSYYVISRAERLIDYVTLLFEGFVLCLVFCSSLRDAFTKSTKVA
jgi:hypothetical protein